MGRVVQGPLNADDRGPPFLIEAAAKLPPEPWDETTWKSWTSGLAGFFGPQGKALFHPLRLALTARRRAPRWPGSAADRPREGRGASQGADG